MIPNDNGMAECSDEEWSLAQADAACDFIEAVPLSAMDNPAMVTEMWARFRKLASAWRNRGEVMEEREACAKVAASSRHSSSSPLEIAIAIRARK